MGADLNIYTLGDAHLGKKFEHGVPLHRRGDRERLQIEQFWYELDTVCDVNLQVGDLFDKMFVPYTIINQAYEAYRDAIIRNPSTTYVVLRGNHDGSRDADVISAFQIFTKMVRPLGVVVVDDEAQQLGDAMIVPWHPFKSALEMLPEDLTGLTIYGHWDIVMGDTNQIPAAEMKARGALAAFTGHDHNARVMEIEGLPVTVVGSMQPYSHGEDEEGLLYVTLTLAELDGLDVRDKCVRLVLDHDEVLEFPVDCLQLQVQRGKAESVGLEVVEFEDFDFGSLYDQAVLEVGLSSDFAKLARAKFDALR